MMHNYSENWQHLQSILNGFATINQRHDLHSYADHTQAKALSIFLAHATLGTPKLDRSTVEAVLKGRQLWPHTSDKPRFNGVNVPLSLLEENGLVAFYADWCTIHCQTVKDLNNVDPSLVPLIQAVEHLKDICYGRNDYIQPHYTCPADELHKLLTPHFGNASIEELLPGLLLENGYFKLTPGNQNFSPLVSTYLWLKLRETLEPNETFERWLLCFRINCDWAMPVLFDQLDYSEQAEFKNQLIAHLAQDMALCHSMDTLWKQAVSADSFPSIVTPIRTDLHVTIGVNGNNRTELQEIIELEKPTLAMLDAAYPQSPYSNEPSDLELVEERRQHFREPELFYTGLLVSAIDTSIHVNGHMLTSSDFVESLLGLATTRPILKHLLFNLLPAYQKASYKIFLLSRPNTCDIALSYLTQRSFSNVRRDNYSFTQLFDKGYQQLVCHEYLRAIEKESDCGNRLIKIVELLGARCDLHSSVFSKSFEYQFLLCLLDKLSHQHTAQLGQAFTQQPFATEDEIVHRPLHYRYLVGFWLIERIEDAGISGDLIHSLKTTILNYYKTEFEANLIGHQRNLKPNAFFSTLPWHRLIGDDGGGPLLALSNKCSDWPKNLVFSNENSFAAASAIRHYLQILMCAGRPQRFSKSWERIPVRVVEIVRTLGFGQREQANYLFDTFYSNQYDLWTPFCSYTNLIQDSIFDDFVERCVSLIPLDQLFVLYEQSTVIARTQKLQDEIANRQSPESEDLGLFSLERAFISACDFGHTDLAKKLMTDAEKLFQERFTNTKNPHILRARKVWFNYQYKWKLISLLETMKSQPDNFAEAARNIPLPHDPHDKFYQGDDHAHRQECERFRRYIIAAAYQDTEPEKCVKIMEVLYQESKSSHHSFMLFKGRLVLHEINKDKTTLRHALSQFLKSINDIEPEHMSPPWIAAILDVYRQLHDAVGIDEFWQKLSPDQQSRREILHPYCKMLIERGDAPIANQIIKRYRDLNAQTSEGLKLDDLDDDLSNAASGKLLMRQIVQMVNEDSQRTIVQLAKHYSQIVSKDFGDYVAIVGQGKLSEEFLRDAMIDVARELVLRKKNLQVHANQDNKESRRITKEDLINDWFTSLFDHRMAEARIGFRDQKRGGQSESGNSPGEVDGYITDAKNKRIAIFEAFRLFSKDTTVISGHLNKIAGYDNESLSPVFIAAYCDVNDFNGLVRDYAGFIGNQDYAGFTTDSEIGNMVQPLHDTDHLWLGMERRRRNHREVIFYHLLLNMRD